MERFDLRRRARHKNRITTYGTASADEFFGSTGPNTFYGGNGDDFITGGKGRDNLLGQGGNDTIIGGRDWDVIQGGPGNDFIDGRAGTDTLYGGSGSDTFYYHQYINPHSNGPGSDSLGNDRIHNIELNKDTILLDGLDYTVGSNVYGTVVHLFNEFDGLKAGEIRVTGVDKADFIAADIIEFA